VPTFLLRHYLSTDGADSRDALGVALAQALALATGSAPVIGRAAWLTLLVEATAVAEDERILPAAAELIAGLQAEWPLQTRIDEASASVEACLRAAEIVNPDELVQGAIDQLERQAGSPSGRRTSGGAAIRVRVPGDHVRGASALFGVTTGGCPIRCWRKS
jgi:hypothetical protein